MDSMNKQINNLSHLFLSPFFLWKFKSVDKSKWSALRYKWRNLLSGGVDKLVFSVAVMFPISHDLRRRLSLYVYLFAQSPEWRCKSKEWMEYCMDDGHSDCSKALLVRYSGRRF